MLASKKGINHTLTVEISEEYKYLVKISVFDSNNRIIESEISSRLAIVFRLPLGLYTIRIEMNGEIKDDVILLDKEKKYKIGNNKSYDDNIKIISPPQQFSSALLDGTYGSSHEYYTYPAVEWSKTDTYKLEEYNKEGNSSLFVFLRFPSIEKFDILKPTFSKPFYSDFKIVDEFGTLLTDFDSKKGIEFDEQKGWVAFNAILPNGIYYLLYTGNESRQIPIFIYRNWHTQFFMTLADQPLFGTIRIFLTKQREFFPNDGTNKYIDILLDKLQNQDFNLDKELIAMVAHGKYDSPMLGLICSYIYLQSMETRSDNLFQIIAQNMQNIILKDNQESPDLFALNILASNHFLNFKYKNESIIGTPMMRIGFEAILKASIQDKGLIPQNSINDFISENLYYDSPFNTFKPIPFGKTPVTRFKNVENPNTRIDEGATSVIGMTDFFDEKKEQTLETGLEEIDPNLDIFSISIHNYLNPNIINIIKSPEVNMGTEANWVRSSIINLLRTNDRLSINDISNQLNLSGNTITRIFNDWQNEIKDIK